MRQKLHSFPNIERTKRFLHFPDSWEGCLKKEHAVKSKQKVKKWQGRVLEVLISNTLPTSKRVYSLPR